MRIFNRTGRNFFSCLSKKNIHRHILYAISIKRKDRMPHRCGGKLDEEGKSEDFLCWFAIYS